MRVLLLTLFHYAVSALELDVFPGDETLSLLQVGVSKAHEDPEDEGRHTLLTIPKASHAKDANLHIVAYVEPVGNDDNDLWIRRVTVSGKWVGQSYAFKTSSGAFGTEPTHLVRRGLARRNEGKWVNPEDVSDSNFVVMPVNSSAPTKDLEQSSSSRVQLKCGPVTAHIRFQTAKKNGQDVNHIDLKLDGLCG